MTDPIAILNALLGCAADTKGPFGPAEAVEVYQWACPLRSCNWVYWSIDEADAKAAFLGDPQIAMRAFGRPGGEVHGHIHTAHKVEEYVQELVDLRPVPAEVAPLAIAEKLGIEAT